MKKLLLLLTMCAVLTSCASAGTKTSTDNLSVTESSVAEKTAETGTPEAELLQLTDCYKSEKITVPKDLYCITTVETFNNSDDVIIYGIDESYDNYSYYKTDKTFSEYTPFEYPYPEEADNYDAVYDALSFNPDGSFNTIITLENHGGITLEAVKSGEYDYDTYYENCVTSYMICTYDKDGNLLTKSTFEYPESFYDDYGSLYYTGIIADGDSFIVVDNNNNFWKISSDGEFTKFFTYENESDSYVYYNLIRDRDGKIICTISSDVLNDDDTYSRSTSFYEITDNGLSEKPFIKFDDNEITENVSVGYGEYRLFIPKYDSLYGLTDDGNLESVINWSDSNIQAMYTLPIGEDEFIGIDNNNRLLKLTPRDMSEFANTKIITIASPMAYGLEESRDIINDFNNSRTDYRIKTVSIGGETDGEGLYSSENALNMMILTGEIPDIIFGLKYDSFVNYRKKDVFTDMYSLIDSDSELSREDFMPNIISALESPDGKLFGLSESFGVATLYTKTSVWNKENWTLDEFIEAHDNAPDSFAHLYDGTTKIEMLNNMTYAMTDFIDYENVTCNFDNSDFIKILEFCNRFVDEVVTPSKEYDYEAFSNYHADKYKWLGNEQIIYEKGDACSYNFIKYLQANGDDLTFAGYPSYGGKGGLIIPNNLLCISESCENKQGAWEFVKYYINNNKYGCSMLSDSFEKYMDTKLTEKSTANGNEIPSFDKQTRDKVAEYIKSCSKLGTMYDYPNYSAFDNEIMSIMEEEAGLYFTGEQTVETASERIQNRISILISERS